MKEFHTDNYETWWTKTEDTQRSTKALHGCALVALMLSKCPCYLATYRFDEVDIKKTKQTKTNL